MKLTVTGLNHKTAPVEVRERLAFDQTALPQVLADLRGVPGVIEGFVLSTCNRVEVALTADDASDARHCAEQFLSRSRNVEPLSLRPHLYHYEDRDAVHHLFRVACSLDSMVVGEPQILGQLKQAWEIARLQGSISSVLDTVLTSAFSVAKRVRSETDIGQSAVSISYAAVEMARQIFGSLKGHRVLLVGAGKMSELAARHLARAGVGEILVTNRSPERASQMAEMFDGRIVDYLSFASVLTNIDVVIASSGAPHYILTKEDMKRVLGARRNRPMFLIDIAVPRNIEPSVNELEGVFLYDIDDLQEVVSRNVESRKQEAAEAEKIVLDEVDRLLARLRTREMAPMIVSLQQQLESIRAGEIERMRGKLGPLTPPQEQAIEALTKGIINKIAHAPIAELRRHAGHPNRSHLIEVIRKVFGLESI
jgi:glutamyl-tRNA reductase